MTARSVIEHALSVYYADSRDRQAIVAQLLDQYDAERDAAREQSSRPADPVPPEPHPLT